MSITYSSRPWEHQVPPHYEHALSCRNRWWYHSPPLRKFLVLFFDVFWALLSAGSTTVVRSWLWCVSREIWQAWKRHFRNVSKPAQALKQNKIEQPLCGSKICIQTIKPRRWTLSEIRDICGHMVANRDFQELESKHPSPSLSFFGSM